MPSNKPGRFCNRVSVTCTFFFFFYRRSGVVPRFRRRRGRMRWTTNVNTVTNATAVVGTFSVGEPEGGTRHARTVGPASARHWSAATAPPVPRPRHRRRCRRRHRHDRPSFAARTFSPHSNSVAGVTERLNIRLHTFVRVSVCVSSFLCSIGFRLHLR